jgi:hypothetical protein
MHKGDIYFFINSQQIIGGCGIVELISEKDPAILAEHHPLSPHHKARAGAQPDQHRSFLRTHAGTLLVPVVCKNFAQPLSS